MGMPMTQAVMMLLKKMTCRLTPSAVTPADGVLTSVSPWSTLTGSSEGWATLRVVRVARVVRGLTSVFTSCFST